MGKAKLNIPMCVALVLLLLTMITTHLTSGLYARYSVSATSSDQARVAKFAVKGTSSGDVTVISDSSSNGIYAFTVTNESEVAISYTLDMMFDVAAKDWLALELDKTETGTYFNDKSCSFSTVYELTPGEARNHSVSFSVSNWAPVTSQNTQIVQNASDTWNLHFHVLVHAQQID